MKFQSLFGGLLAASSLISATILQNGQARITDYPDTKIDPSSYTFTTYLPNATELSYKGRWDSKYTSWWSAPGLKFGFTGSQVAISFGAQTSNGVLLAYRLSGMDWSFTNITTSATHLLITPTTPGLNATYPLPRYLEIRVTNWAYGIQISSVHVSAGETLVKIPDFGRRIEFIGDSLTSGMYTTYEGLSSFGYLTSAGLGDTEYSITAYPGICVYDKLCFGNARGQEHQWWITSDTSGRPGSQDPEPWTFPKGQEADIVVINIGTNDNNDANGPVSPADYEQAYKNLIMGVHAQYPKAEIVFMNVWLGFFQNGNSYGQSSNTFAAVWSSLLSHFNSPSYLTNPILYNGLTNTTYAKYGNSSTYSNVTKTPDKPFLHLFNTTGILNFNDIGPQYHPTDVGALKVANHLMRFINIKFGWDLLNTGAMVQSGTLYWNDEEDY